MEEAQLPRDPGCGDRREAETGVMGQESKDSEGFSGKARQNRSRSWRKSLHRTGGKWAAELGCSDDFFSQPHHLACPKHREHVMFI